MDISNNPTPEIKRQPVSVAVRIMCTVVLLSCSVALPVLLYYIGLADANPTIPTAIALSVTALCLLFTLGLCRKKVFLICAALGLLAVSLVSPWFGALYASLLCATVAGAALLADAKGFSYLPFTVAAPAAYVISLLLTRAPILCLLSLLPALGAIALCICFRKKYSVIISVGTLTGTLTVASLLLLIIELFAAGMQPTVAGVQQVLDEYHAAFSAIFAQALQTMAETEELAMQIKPMLGGEITPEIIKEFSDSVATATMGLLPGSSIMLLWIFSFTAHRGFTALLVKDLPKQAIPAHLSAYEPSLPSAILTVLCYVALMISSFLPGGEPVVFVCLNVLAVLLPMMGIYGLLAIIAGLRRAPVKWPLILTYVIAIFFLGFTVIPMIAFYGSFGVIAQAAARALEKKLNSSQGGQ